MDLRALTFNVRYDNPRDGSHSWPFRKEAVFLFLNSLKCHVIGFQEVLAHQRADLETSLDDYQWVGIGRNLGDTGEQCCLAVHSSFEILEQGTFWLSPTPDIPGCIGWDAQLTRICTWARLRKAGVTFLVLNSHWDHKGEIARLESAKLLLQQATNLREPVLVMGDFNAPPDSEPIAVLASALQDCYAIDNPGCHLGTFHGFGKTTPTARIDYLFASSDFLTVESRILEDISAPPYLSDHYPVWASLELSVETAGPKVAKLEEADRT